MAGPKWAHCLKWACGALLSITSSWVPYIAQAKATHTSKKRKTPFFFPLLLQHPSSSIHDAHFLCLRRLFFSSFAFLIRFFTLQLAHSGYFFCCCSSSFTHVVCVLRWIRIASCFFYRLLRRFFCSILFCWSFSLFLSMNPVFTLAHRATAWCPLVGNGLRLSFSHSLSITFSASYTLFLSLSPPNNYINIVLCCLLSIVHSVQRQYIEELTYHRPKLCLKTIKISARIKRERKKIEKLSLIRYVLFSVMRREETLIPFDFFFRFRSIVPNYSICCIKSNKNNNGEKITLKSLTKENRTAERSDRRKTGGRGERNKKKLIRN